MPSERSFGHSSCLGYSRYQSLHESYVSQTLSSYCCAPLYSMIAAVGGETIQTGAYVWSSGNSSTVTDTVAPSQMFDFSLREEPLCIIPRGAGTDVSRYQLSSWIVEELLSMAEAPGGIG